MRFFYFFSLLVLLSNSAVSQNLIIRVTYIDLPQKTLLVSCDRNGQIIPESIPGNVEIVDINNDNRLDAFIFNENKLELHYGITRGFSKTENAVWEFDLPIQRITGNYDKRLMRHRLDIEFDNGQQDYLMQWANKIISRSEYDAHPEKYQVKRELPKTLQVSNGFQIVWENENLGYHLYNVLTGDLDQDGKKELIVATWPILWGTWHVLHIYENVSDNTYQEVFTFQDSTYDFGVMEITDLDADGNLELCVFSGGGPPGWTLDPYLILFENCGDNCFNRQMVPAYVNLNEIYPNCARWADSNLNGKPELVIGFDRDNLNTHDTYVEFYENLVPNTFVLLQWWLRIHQLPVHGIAVGDLDNDGWGDIYVGMTGASTQIHRWEYDGYQSFQQKWFDTGICNPIYPEIFDFDQDSLPELVVLSDYWDWYPGRSAILYLKAGNNDVFQIIGLDTTSYYHGSYCLWGRNWYNINNEFYITAPAEIFIEGSQYFDGYAILLKRNPNFQYPFEPIFYSPVVDSTAIHHALATDLDNDDRVELITGKEFYPARVRIWEENIIGIEDEKNIKIDNLFLQAFPNPFNSTTVIHFVLPKAGKIDLTIYNILGQKVDQPLKQIFYPAGQHQITLNEKNLNLHTSGVYLTEMKSGSFRKVRKMLLIR